MPNRFEVATGLSQLNGVFIEVDDLSGKTVKIERLQKYFE